MWSGLEILNIGPTKDTGNLQVSRTIKEGTSTRTIHFQNVNVLIYVSNKSSSYVGLLV